MKKYFESMISEDIEVGVALAQACVKSGDYEAHFDHDYLDELMLNVLRAWEGFGSEELELSRGKLNAYFIQVWHVGMMGGDLGTVPEWNIDDVWLRLQLFSVLKGSLS
jgi:hypothetical protein